MAENITIARPYARAIFKEARETNRTQEWLELLETLASLISSPEMMSLIQNPKLTLNQQVEILHDSLELHLKDKKQMLNEAMNNILMLLAKAKRLALVPDIFVLYRKMLTEEQGIINVKVTSAKPLEEHLREKMKNTLENKFKAKVLIDYSLDEDLIGGAIIRTDDWVMDGSIRGKLERLREKMS